MFANLTLEEHISVVQDITEIRFDCQGWHGEEGAVYFFAKSCSAAHVVPLDRIERVHLDEISRYFNGGLHCFNEKKVFNPILDGVLPCFNER